MDLASRFLVDLDLGLLSLEGGLEDEGLLKLSERVDGLAADNVGTEGLLEGGLLGADDFVNPVRLPHLVRLDVQHVLIDTRVPPERELVLVRLQIDLGLTTLTTASARHGVAGLGPAAAIGCLWRRSLLLGWSLLVLLRRLARLGHLAEAGSHHLSEGVELSLGTSSLIIGRRLVVVQRHFLLLRVASVASAEAVEGRLAGLRMGTATAVVLLLALIAAVVVLRVLATAIVPSSVVVVTVVVFFAAGLGGVIFPLEVVVVAGLGTTVTPGVAAWLLTLTSLAAVIVVVPLLVVATLVVAVIVSGSVHLCDVAYF